MFVTNFSSDNVSVISDATNSIVANVSVGSPTLGVSYDSGTGEVFVTDYDSDNVSVINTTTNTVVATIPVGSYPWALTYDVRMGEIFAANYLSNNVSVINDTTDGVVATIPVGNYPDGLAYDGAQGQVYVANYWSNDVSVVSDGTNSVGTTVDVGVTPSDITYDSGNGNLYVSNYEGGTISIISPTGATGPSQGVSFGETGLPNGTVWSVSLNGTTRTSSSASIAFSEPSGLYSYSVGPVAGYLASPISGTVVVAATGVSTLISFVASSPPPPPTYRVSVTETGLGAGTNWSANLAGTATSSRTNTIVFFEPNGSYDLSIPALANYSSNYSNSVIVGGVPVSVAVTFSSATYPVTFLESGLPAGSPWTVSATSDAVTSGQSTGTTVTLQLADGTYALSAAGPTGFHVTLSASSVSVRGAAPPSLSVTFTAAPPGLVTSNSLPWLTIGVLVVTCLAAVVGAGWGYSRYRFAKWKSEAQIWEQEFHNGNDPAGDLPPR